MGEGEGEHDLIRRIRSILPAAAGVSVGPGDDCAVLRPDPGRDLLFTTDAAVEGVHFDFRWLSARAAGRRAMAANISDIAAMAGRPRWAVVALGLPGAAAGDKALAILHGAARFAEAHGAGVVGGNIARAPGGISITVGLLGDVERGRAVLRSGARAGDELWVTGALGWAMAGIEALVRGLGGEEEAAPFVERFRAPVPRVEEAIFLRDRAAVRAMLDLSDGLAGDVRHMAEESRVGATIDREALPLDERLEAFARRLGFDGRDLALAGGEDFELLVAAEPGRVEAVRSEFENRFRLPLTRVGRIEPGGGVCLAGGRPLEVEGFDHFRDRGTERGPDCARDP